MELGAAITSSFVRHMFSYIGLAKEGNRLDNEEPTQGRVP